MYRTLWQIFPYDRLVYEEILRTGQPLYTLISYAMYQRDEFLGHAGIMPMRIWMDNIQRDIIGIGAVATVPKFRRMGVAQFLMERCIEAIDSRQIQAALFTELPAVYEAHGFNIFNQNYVASKIVNGISSQAGYEYKIHDVLSVTDTTEMDEVYTNRYPNYDGKIVRDEAYWALYRMFFNPYPKPKIISLHNGGHLQGYVRFDHDDDRLTMTELCVGKDEIVIAESLLAAVFAYARKWGLKLCTFAMPQEHFAWELLVRKGIDCVPEPQGIRREIFMVRPGVGKEVEFHRDFQWSLADKF